MKKKSPIQWFKLRAASRKAAAENYPLNEDAPTMRLSSAMIVVFLLHVVAVGGIWAFNHVKERRTSTVVQAPKSTVASAPVAMTSPKPEIVSPVQTRESAPLVEATQPVKPKAHTAPAVAKATTAVKAPEIKHPVAAAPTVGASADTYVVAKGDNPYTIAKKLHCNYEDLLRVNNIADARKLQIGQKLKVPSR